MKPGWEDLVRRCIQRFHLQNDGEMSFAKRHQQEGNSINYEDNGVKFFALDIRVIVDGCISMKRLFKEGLQPH